MYIHMYTASQLWKMINFPPTITPLFESETVSICFLIEYLTHNCSLIKIICQRSRLLYIYTCTRKCVTCMLGSPQLFDCNILKWISYFWIRSLQSRVQIQCLTHITVVFRFRGIDAHVLHGKSKCARSWFSDDKVTLQISLWQFVHIFLLYFQTSDSSHLF